MNYYKVDLTKENMLW